MTTANERFYLHGDESEVTSGAFYCRGCDMFHPAEHFSAPCRGESHAAIYEHHYRNFLAVSRLATINRPERAPSVASNFRTPADA